MNVPNRIENNEILAKCHNGTLRNDHDGQERLWCNDTNTLSGSNFPCLFDPMSLYLWCVKGLKVKDVTRQK